MGKWINAETKQQPCHMEQVLVFCPNFSTLDKMKIRMAFWNAEERLFEIIDDGGWDGCEPGEVTYWRELPEPPE